MTRPAGPASAMARCAAQDVIVTERHGRSRNTACALPRRESAGPPTRPQPARPASGRKRSLRSSRIGATRLVSRVAWIDGRCEEFTGPITSLHLTITCFRLMAAPDRQPSLLETASGGLCKVPGGARPVGHSVRRNRPSARGGPRAGPERSSRRLRHLQPSAGEAVAGGGVTAAGRWVPRITGNRGARGDGTCHVPAVMAVTSPGNIDDTASPWKTLQVAGPRQLCTCCRSPATDE